jgi:hypothetical protein
MDGQHEEPKEAGGEEAAGRAESLLATLANEMVALARRAQYLPASEIPYVAELEEQGQKIVTGVCAAISDRMQQGMPHEELARVFGDVILRTFDAVYRWHASPDGKVEVPPVAGDPARDEFRGALPADLAAQVRELPAAGLLYEVLVGWIARNRERLEAEKIDLWVPVVTALQMTVMVAAAMALKVFGALEDEPAGG